MYTNLRQWPSLYSYLKNFSSITYSDMLCIEYHNFCWYVDKLLPSWRISISLCTHNCIHNKLIILDLSWYFFYLLFEKSWISDMPLQIPCTQMMRLLKWTGEIISVRYRLYQSENVLLAQKDTRIPGLYASLYCLISKSCH